MGASSTPELLFSRVSRSSKYGFSARYKSDLKLRKPTIRGNAISDRLTVCLKNGHQSAEVLDADGQQFLGFLKEAGCRLAKLVSDLLAYTIASMAELSDTSVHHRSREDGR